MAEPDSTPDPNQPKGYLQTLGKIGKYVLLKKIAEGGMGSIYMARNPSKNEVVAIKVMSPNNVHNPILLKRFEQEYRVASKFEHPNLVRALEYGEENELPFLVLEFVNGDSLGSLIDQKEKFQEIEGIKIIAQVAIGLNRMHRDNLIHRDVKPDNILVTKTGLAKLTDLGLVKEKFAGDLNLTQSGRGLGTPNFMAPEQFRDAKNADKRCDIYSLGATLYTMLTGALPYKSANPLETWMKKVQNDVPSPRELNPAISQRTDWAIRRAMDSDPDIRPANCREFVEDLTGKSTRKTTVEITTSDKAAPPLDSWFMSYFDDKGKQHIVKGTIKAIRRSFKDGILEDPTRYKLSKQSSGPFEDMRNLPEFRDLVVNLTKAVLAPGITNNLKIVPSQQILTSEPNIELKPKFSLPTWVFYTIGVGVILGAIITIITTALFLSNR